MAADGAGGTGAGAAFSLLRPQVGEIRGGKPYAGCVGWVAGGVVAGGVVPSIAVSGRVTKVVGTRRGHVAHHGNTRFGETIRRTRNPGGMATAILIDVMLVRLLLVPDAMAAFGRADWYLPGWLDRVFGRFSRRAREPVAVPDRAPEPSAPGPRGHA